MTYSPSTFYDFLGITPLLPPEILRVFQNIPSDHVQVLILRRVANIIKSVLIVYNFQVLTLLKLRKMNGGWLVFWSGLVDLGVRDACSDL
jgi:hypothetical protein